MTTKYIQNQQQKTAVIYVRVSSKMQLEGYSLENQEEICRSYANQQGFKVLRLFSERGESAKTADRTKLQEMLRYCAQKKNSVNYVIVYKVDRLARNAADHFYIKALLLKYGTKILSASEPIKDDAQGRLMETMLSGFSQFDNDVRSARTKDNMLSALARGKWMFKAPVGYVSKKLGKRNSLLMKDPKSAPLVQMVFEEYIKGIYSFRQVADIVKKHDINNAFAISPQLVAKMLRNKLYYGRIEVPKWEIYVDALHEPIISKATFQKANAIIEGNKGHKQTRNRNHPYFPLRGLKCGHCGHSMTGGWTRGKLGKRYAYYSCGNSNCEARKSISKKEFEGQFTNFLLRLTPRQEQLDLLKEILVEVYRSETSQMIKERTQRDHQIQKLVEQKELLLEQKIQKNNLITDEDYKMLRQKFEDRIAKLETLNASMPSFEVEAEKIISYGMEFINTLPSVWSSLSPSELKTLLSILFPGRVVYDHQVIQTPDPSIFYKLDQQNLGDKNALVAPRGIEPRLLA